MSKVTSKLQITIPKAIADQYSISPGDELEWEPAVDAVRIVPAKTRKRTTNAAGQLRLFDAATKRQRNRESENPPQSAAVERGWTREELYERGSSR